MCFTRDGIARILRRRKHRKIKLGGFFPPLNLMQEVCVVRNLTMMTDLYQLTMMYGYFKAGKHNEKAVYDLFFRRRGDETNYAVCAGLEQVIELINNLRFEEEDINYLEIVEPV